MIKGRFRTWYLLAQLQGLVPAIVVDGTQSRKDKVGGPLSSELMIGNDGAEDTWDNDGVADSPDD